AHSAAGGRPPRGHGAADAGPYRRDGAAVAGKLKNPLIPAKAGIQSKLDSRFRGNERSKWRVRMYENLLANVPTDLWIGGQWRKSSDNQRFDVTDPATEKVIASVASATVEDAKAAVDAAQDAFAGWAARKPRERAEILRKAYELTIRDAERFAKLITLEN